MKTKLFLSLLFVTASFIFGCKEIIENNKTVYIDDVNKKGIYNSTGVAQKGMALYGGLARGQGVDVSNDLQQTGTTYTDFINNYFGYYDFGLVSDQFFQVFVTANFHNEVTGGISDVMNLHSYVYLPGAGDRNVNALTTMRSPIQEKLFKIDYSAQPMPDRWENARDEAETRILNYFNMPSLGPGVHFGDADMSSDTKADQVLVAVSSIILNARPTSSQHAELMANISGALASSQSGDTSLRTEILTLAKDIDIISVRDNIEERFNYLGMPEKKSPKFWNHLDMDFDGIRNDDDPDSYIELITETHEIKGWSRIADTCNLSFDTTNQRFFANPVIFNSEITTAKYLASNFASQYMSIYSVNDHGTVDTSDDTPEAPLAVFDGATYVSKIPYNYLQEQYLDASDDSYSVPQSFTAVITGHSIPVGVNVYVVFWSDAGYRPTGLCQSGEFVKFSRNQYSADGVSWLGAAPQPLNPVYGRYNLLKGAWLD